MWLDLIAILLLAFFIGMGAVRGMVAAAMGVISLAVAYAVAILAAPRLGAAVAAGLDIAELIAIPLAGTAAFLVSYILMGIVSRRLRERDLRRTRGHRSPRDRFMGGVFGLLRGGFLILLLSWLALWVDALRATGVAPGLPAVGPSTAAALTERVVEAGVQAALGDESPGGRMMARMAARPATAFTDFQAVMDHPAIADLQRDTMFWSYVEHGNVDAALNRVSFLRITRDDELRHQLGGLGLIDEAAVDDTRMFRVAASDVFREVGPRIRGLREDPELQQLLEDPEVVAMLQSGNSIGLMSHPGFRSVVSRAMADGE